MTSIAKCMTGVKGQDITQLVVTDTTASVSQKLRSSLGHRDNVLSSSITTSYVVTSTDSAQSYDGLSTQLQDAVSVGSFDTYLHNAAAASGATGFASATSSSVTTTDDLDSGSDGKKGLSAGAIAGIVIGVVTLLCAAAFFLLVRRPSTPLAEAAQPSSVGTIHLSPIPNKT